MDWWHRFCSSIGEQNAFGGGLAAAAGGDRTGPCAVATLSDSVCSFEPSVQKRSKPFTMTATVLSMCQVACSAALENVTQQMPSGSAQPATGTYGGLITKATNVVAGYVYDLFCSCRSLLWWMPAAVSHGQMCWVSCCQLCCCSQGCNGWP